MFLFKVVGYYTPESNFDNGYVSTPDQDWEQFEDSDDEISVLDVVECLPPIVEGGAPIEIGNGISSTRVFRRLGSDICHAIGSFLYQRTPAEKAALQAQFNKETVARKAKKAVKQK